MTEVDPNAPAAQWLQPGDVIEEINHQRISSVADFQKIADMLNPQEKQMLFICRGKVRSFVVISPK